MDNPGPAPKAATVQMQGLSKRFGTFLAVDNLSLTITKGEIVGFIGPNGAGKSTTLRMLCGLLRPSGGSAFVAGYDVARCPEEVRAHIGYMSQKFSLYSDLTVRENLRFFAGMYHVPRREMNSRMAQAIATAGLEGREDALVETLAGGWKQRLALGCAILHRPPVLFLDEPTSGVEPEARRHFWDMIHNLAGSGVTILVSTHYMDEAEYCNRIALINAGKLVAVGSPGQLRRHELGGELFEISCNMLGAGLTKLRQAPGVIDAAIFGDKLHVLLSDSSAAADLPSWLGEDGFIAGTPCRITPSLEDVFVQLVSRGHSEGAHP
ncbi:MULTISPECIES: ATP-binding cassette domain-containing protein [unclassified Rhizobium]|uniref:ABC transporter ATP-binding protein n=1 Tax=unclassified Rhizobium TaxID=2613769 RepID=UPI00381F472D